MATIKRVDHIAIAVRNLEKSITLFETLFGAKLITKKRGTMQGHPMAVAYMQVGENIFALDEAVDPDGFIAKFIEKRGEGLHHLGLEVDDLDEYIQELEAKNIRIPVKDLDGEFRREILLSPREANGVVWQVIEWQSGPDLSLEERIERLHQYREVDEQRLQE
jgi:lactoylglutathione lyase/methylmalonyl-CoA/ethylmalonyl-CoA epimerase